MKYIFLLKDIISISNTKVSHISKLEVRTQSILTKIISEYENGKTVFTRLILNV